MAKKFGFNPYIVHSGVNFEGGAVVIGGGSGQGSTDPINASPCSYAFWLEHFAEDVIQNGTIDEYDFGAWWEGNGFTKEDWEELNPGLSWDEYVLGT